VRDTLEGAMERLELLLSECIHKYQHSLVLCAMLYCDSLMLMRQVVKEVGHVRRDCPLEMRTTYRH
jgi:hypothetical protein